MSKKITMTARPKAKAEIDKWVETREPAAVEKPAVKPKRLTIDINPDLHKKLKISCVTATSKSRTSSERELVDQAHLIADR